MNDNPMLPIVIFLFEEVKLLRAKTLSPADEYALHSMVRRADRQNRRLRRVADALTKLDESNPPPPPAQ